MSRNESVDGGSLHNVSANATIYDAAERTRSNSKVLERLWSWGTGRGNSLRPKTSQGFNGEETIYTSSMPMTVLQTRMVLS